MLLAYNELVDLVRFGVIQDVDESSVNGTTINLTLGRELMIEDDPKWAEVVDLAAGGTPKLRKVPCVDGYQLVPGQFVLGYTEQAFNLPPYLSAEFMLRSSHGRSGLEHQLAGWIDPGFQGQITLELSNVLSNHRLMLTAGMSIGQVKFFRHVPVPESKNYGAIGRYQGQSGVTPSKGL